MSELLSGLNEKQQEAVKQVEGPVLVLAGAGSGKTRALTHRIAYMIKECGISPHNILAVTFTNKAAKEMRERVVGLLKEKELSDIESIFGVSIERYDLPTIGTFHAFCVRLLRRHIHHLDYENSFVIYDGSDQLILMKRILKSLKLDPKKVNPKAVLHQISMAKNQLIGPEQYGDFASDYFSEKVAEIYPYYQDALKTANALDFDDLIMQSVLLLKRFPQVLASLQERYRYISVDEYQDTNRAQYELVKTLAAKSGNICVIGDIDQSIYSWRGATISNILDFEKDYEEAKVIKLEQNYRSTEVILEASNGIISKNSQRKSKNLWTERSGGEKIKHWVADNERHEAQLVAEEISKVLANHEYRDFRSFAILYRTNAQSRVVEEVFLRYGIPYKLVGGIRFYERKEIKDVLAYLRVVQNPHDTVSLLRIINTPSRKIGAKTLEIVQDFASRNRISLFSALSAASDISELSAKKVAVLSGFVDLIKNLQRVNGTHKAAGMVKEVLEESGYKRMLDDGSVEGEARLENVGELISVAKKYDGLEAGMSLNIFLEEVSLIADVDNLEEDDNAVVLMTVHSAKGLEFGRVFVLGLEEGVFPHNRSMYDQMELEEERRLMYVAMTRAMDCLYLLHTKNRTVYGETKSNIPSQFLDDLDEELVESNFVRSAMQGGLKKIAAYTPIPVEGPEIESLELAVGDRVLHNGFGRGIVIGVTGGVVTIAFSEKGVGVKKLALSVAPLKKI